MEQSEIIEIENELNVKKVRKVDLQPYIKYKSKSAYSATMKIGVLGQDIAGLSTQKKGSIVLFRQYTVEECYGKMDWETMKRHCNLCTVETPSSDGESSHNCIVGVPIEYIEYELFV